MLSEDWAWASGSFCCRTGENTTSLELSRVGAESQIQNQEAPFLCLRHLAFGSLGFLIYRKGILSASWVCYEEETDECLHSLHVGAEGTCALKSSLRSALTWACATPEEGAALFNSFLQRARFYNFTKSPNRLAEDLSIK